MRLSYSKVSTFIQCPQKYKFSYVERRPRPGGNMFASIGTAAHAVAEDLINEHVDARKVGRLDRGRIPELLRKAWADNDLPGTEEDFSTALAWLNRWADLEGEIHFEQVVGTEIKFKIKLPCGTEITGIIDRVDRDLTTGRHEIIDYKTNRSLYSAIDLENSLQLSTYALAGRKLFDEGDPLLTYTMFAHGVRQRTTRTAARIDATGHYLSAAASVMQAARKFPAQLSVLCGWCDYAGDCPAYQAGLTKEHDEIEGPLTIDQAVHFRQRFHAIGRIADKRKKEAEKSIRAYLKEHGSFERHGEKFYFYNLESVDYDTGEVLRTLAGQTGMDPAEIAAAICTVKAKDVRNFVEGLDIVRGRALALSTELEVLGEVKVSPRLSTKKIR